LSYALEGTTPMQRAVDALHHRCTARSSGNCLEGDPMNTNLPPQDPRRHDDPPVTEVAPLRSSTARFEPPRRRWPGLLAAGIVGVGIAMVAISSFYTPNGAVPPAADPVLSSTPAEPSATPADPAVAAAPADPAVAAAPADPAATAGGGVVDAVKAALASDPALATAPVDVTADAGVVTLAGRAPDADARTRAELLASAAPGVSRVENQLTIEGTTTQ
jgi:hypothetical protein